MKKVVCGGGRRVERQVFYLGEINDSQRQGWLKLIEAFDAESQQQTKLALFASGRPVPMHAADFAVQNLAATQCTWPTTCPRLDGTDTCTCMRLQPSFRFDQACQKTCA